MQLNLLDSIVLNEQEMLNVRGGLGESLKCGSACGSNCGAGCGKVCGEGCGSDIKIGGGPDGTKAQG